MYNKRRQQRILRPVPRDCHFCNNKVEPYYKDTELLNRYISERGKILSHARTGICSKHQRHLAQVIKQARYLALISYTNKI